MTHNTIKLLVLRKGEPYNDPALKEGISREA